MYLMLRKCIPENGYNGKFHIFFYHNEKLSTRKNKT